jgi:hypothetical protein
MSQNQLPNPDYLRNSIQLIEAKLALKQSHFDDLVALGKAQADYDIEEADAKRRSNPTSKAPQRILDLSLLRTREWQSRLSVMQVELQEMTAQCDTWKELLKQAEPALIAEPGGRIVGV